MAKKIKEAVIGFVLGAVGGSIMGVTEDPVDQTLMVMTSPIRLKPLIEDIKTVGALGLGTLMGATALTIAMTSVVAGVVMAAVVASVFVTTRSCGIPHTDYASLWASAGLAGTLGSTLSGATLAFSIEVIVNNYGMTGLLCTLIFFSILKPPLRFVFRVLWKQGEAACCTQTIWEAEKKQLEISELEQRDRVAVQIEDKILTINNGMNTSETEDMMTWATERKLREVIERKKMETEEAEIEQRTLQEWINTVMIKYVDFLAFSSIPMTVVAVVTSVFGLSGYGRHQSVFIALLGLVAIIGYLLLRSSDFKFWMLVGCMGMLTTFIIAMLTIHAGQAVVLNVVNLQGNGNNPNRTRINDRMNEYSAQEALSAAIFAAKLCQLGLGATIGGPLVRHAAGGDKVIVGAAVLAGGLLVAVEILSPVLGNGGKAGALLGVVGASGVSVGAVAAMARRCSSWPRTWGAVAGVIIGALVMGDWQIVKTGLQVIVASVFAMTNAF
ncbi:uncharacterized protein LOC129185374 [Dunckerocampus dactyliophorus]|uniref:uncharacterized protein LOC129185374 n=1 Tax=Dunckerocampus dactyliophorus TaxID=161453 RepID=UPI0024076D43|nr:uncharacterized protein LOC129185374 [Dunckerocampus dactyliophorus]